MSERLIIRNARLLRGDEILTGHALLCRDGVIEAILPDSPHGDYKEFDAKGAYVSPGFVDIHVHGGGGSDFMDEEDTAFDTVVKAHLAHGTTSLMPTTLAASTSALEGAILRYKKAKATKGLGDYLIGLHLEGPYLSPAQAGAQKPGNIRHFTKEEYTHLITLGEGCIKRWSAAPELPGAKEFASLAQENGIALSIAHSDADFDTVMGAMELGFRHATHLYSGMSSVTRRMGFRVAGVVEAAYYADDMDVEIIADGCHLPPSLLKLIIKSKGIAHVALITDAMRAAGQDVTESYLGGKEDPMPAIIEDGVAKLPTRDAFAGSIATTDRLLRTIVGCGIPLPGAVRMLTETPVRMMGITERIGQLQIGYAADLCVFDESINIKAVFKHGKQVI